jgi:nucleotide-binding universal stress UspA family protein
MTASFKSILVPTDFSDTSTEALKHATLLAETFQATLHLLHVVEKPHLAVGGAELMTFSARELVGRVVRAAEKQMAELVAPQPTLTSAVEVGTPFATIVRYAREKHIELIVMGTHGRGGVGHLLLGSVTERVVRSAPCPVMTVRHPGREVVLL